MHYLPVWRRTSIEKGRPSYIIYYSCDTPITFTCMRLLLFIVAGAALFPSVLAEQGAATGSDEPRIESGQSHEKWMQWSDASVEKRGENPYVSETQPSTVNAAAFDEQDSHLVNKREASEHKEKWMQWSDSMIVKRSKRMA